ncbi:hypothetical protein HHI36_018040 [Cryptolaemus montrouzieri]|uniref:Uncharacterized protein n=1 Tax=Cryptolaemus montrouzieri TaxID=559131 RepID=A0ABD2NZS1_9CUCU
MSSEITLDRLYQEITDTRKELKNLITAGEARLALKIETLNRKIQNLESENTVLKERIETLEQKNNKKNLRIRETSNKKCFIRGDRLIVDGTSYTLDRLDGLDFGGDSGIRRRSEPSTPTSTKHFGEVVAGELLSQKVEQQAGDEITLNEGNAPNQHDDYVLAGGTKKLKALQPIKVRTRSQK